MSDRSDRPDNPQQVVLITGASGGIGRAASVALARDGHVVAAAVRNPDKTKALMEEAARHQVQERIACVRMDVTDADSVNRAVAQVLDTYGRIDVLINNAGYASGGLVEETDVEVWRRQFDVNVFGMVRVTRAVIPQMRERGAGKIINIGSVSGRVGFPGLGPYASSKFAVEGFSESLRLELLPFGIHVVLLEPGAYRTDIWDKGLSSFTSDPASPYRAIVQNVLKEVVRSANNAGDPAEVAELLRNIVRDPSPSLRYPVGKGVGMMLMLKQALPWKWLERAAIRRLTKRSGEDAEKGAGGIERPTEGTERPDKQPAQQSRLRE